MRRATEREGEKMIEGTVVWWDVFRGYGFLVDDDGEEYFVHNKALVGQPPGKRNLKKRERVVFEIGEHGGRRCATNVRRLNPNTAVS
jgi:cold shock CspA family protein